MPPSRWHIVTGEFPPQPGGVSDYTYTVAAGLAAAGDDVTVWAPPCTGPERPPAGVAIRRLADHWGLRSLALVGREVGRRDRVLVQYVPQAFGLRGLNLPFCLWVAWLRLGRRRTVDLMLHEVAVPFRSGLHPVNLFAVAHRLMAAVLLAAADRVWVSIPAYGRMARRYSLRAVTPQWLSAFSNIPCVTPTAPPVAWRVGTFGTFGRIYDPLLHAVFAEVLAACPAAELLLVGRGSDNYKSRLVAAHPSLAERVRATGGLDPAGIAAAIRSCQVMVQPYADGVSSRRGTIMAGLANAAPVVTNSGKNTEPVWAATAAVRLVAGRPGDWAAAVGELCDGPSAVALGTAGARLYAEQFAPERVVVALRTHG